MNRYSNYETSAYNPMTTQEIWAPAAAMRQQHNAADEKLQTQIAELDKVSPLDVHYDRAQKIKSDLLKQIEGQAAVLASEGFNGNTTSGVYKTNRQLHEQFSPTGELGQINAAKTAYDTEMANYIKDATENSKIGREQALRNWNKYAKEKYTGYSEDGKKITNIVALGSPAYQDYETDRNQYHALLGSVTSSARASGHGIVTDPTTGLMMMVNRGGKIVHSDNIDALNAAMKGMKDKWVSETGEGRKWADAAGWDPAHTNYRINQDFSAMKEVSNVDDRTENYDVLSGQTPNNKNQEGSQTAISENVELKDLFSNALNGLSRAKQTQKSTPIISDDPMADRSTSGAVSGLKQKEISFKNNLTKDQQKLYIETYNAKKAQGLIPKNAGMYSNEAIDAVEKDWKTKRNFNFTNSIIIPGSQESALLASPTMDKKEAGERDKFAEARLSVARRNKQQLLFNENGKSIDLDDVSEISVVGHYSPANILKPFGGNPDNTVSPHVVSYKDSKGISHTALMPRDANEIKSNPAFKAAKIINKTVNRSAENSGNFTSFNTKTYPELKNMDLSPLGINERGVDGMRVKYDVDNKSYTIELLKNGRSQKTQPLDQQSYQMLMYDMIE